MLLRLNTRSLFILTFNIILLCYVQSPAARSLPDFSSLVDKNSAAVVNISTTMKKSMTLQRRHNIPEIPEDSPFYDFFKNVSVGFV